VCASSFTATKTSQPSSFLPDVERNWDGPSFACSITSTEEAAQQNAAEAKDGKPTLCSAHSVKQGRMGSENKLSNSAFQEMVRLQMSWAARKLLLLRKDPLARSSRLLTLRQRLERAQGARCRPVSRGQRRRHFTHSFQAWRTSPCRKRRRGGPCGSELYLSGSAGVSGERSGRGALRANVDERPAWRNAV